jgi:hypothetical protein
MACISICSNMSKGFDSARIGIQRCPSSASTSNELINEINNFLECHCVTSTFARNYTYVEFLEYFTWHANGKFWNTGHGKHNKISRIAHVSQAQGETFYLHMLLHIVKGAKSFSEIRTVAGQEYPTF